MAAVNIGQAQPTVSRPAFEMAPALVKLIPDQKAVRALLVRREFILFGTDIVQPHREG